MDSLTVFDLPPLIRRDHLINWEDGMYIRIARGASLLFPIPNQITPQPPLGHAEGRMFPLCVCWREEQSCVARRCEFSGGPAESKWRSTCVNILTAAMSHSLPAKHTEGYITSLKRQELQSLSPPTLLMSTLVRWDPFPFSLHIWL